VPGMDGRGHGAGVRIYRTAEQAPQRQCAAGCLLTSRFQVLQRQPRIDDR
jgi:hypothetical protein